MLLLLTLYYNMRLFHVFLFLGLFVGGLYGADCPVLGELGIVGGHCSGYGSGVVIVDSPRALNALDITQTGFSVRWQTNVASGTRVLVGLTKAVEIVIDSVGLTVDHHIVIQGLSAGTIYYVKAISILGKDTAATEITAMVTASISSEEIRVYFNHSVSNSAGLSEVPTGVTGGVCENALVDRINAAGRSIDVAMYNNGSVKIVSALNAAVVRGVRVRYITDKNTSNTSLSGVSLFSVLKRPDDGIMHNKFFIFDALSVSQSWVSTGSMNLSLAQIYSDIIIF